MATFYTSDQHYGHRNILNYSKRSFRDLAHMHQELIRRHNEVVTKDDTVIHLGDFALRLTEIEEKAILDQLNGTHFMIPGNHDRSRASLERIGFKLLTESGQYCKPWNLESYFQITKDGGQNRDDIPVILSHYPYHESDSGYDQRYIERRPKNDGNWLCHGHVHEKWRKRNKQINVGVDVWDFYPVHEQTIIDIIKGE